MMKKTPPTAGADATPDTYVNALRGWRRDCVETLRAAVQSAATLAEAEAALETTIDAFTARRLAAKAVALNKTLGDPTKVAARN